MNKGSGKGQSTRQHILAVATRLLTETGYEATSIETILKAAEISRGALYHHFPSKEHLFEAVFEAVEESVAAVVTKESLLSEDPEARLRAGCHAFLNQSQLSQVRQIALIDAPSVLGWRRWREIEERHGLGLLKFGLRAVAAARGRALEPADELAHLLLAMLIEAALLISRAKDAETARAAATAAFDKVLDGILS